jgi:hypothetical protein
LYKNNEICFCCNIKQETVKYLFTECNHTKIKELRDSLSHKINRVDDMNTYHIVGLGGHETLTIDSDTWSLFVSAVSTTCHYLAPVKLYKDKFTKEKVK